MKSAYKSCFVMLCLLGYQVSHSTWYLWVNTDLHPELVFEAKKIESYPAHGYVYPGPANVRAQIKAPKVQKMGDMHERLIPYADIHGSLIGKNYSEVTSAKEKKLASIKEEYTSCSCCHCLELSCDRYPDDYSVKETGICEASCHFFWHSIFSLGIATPCMLHDCWVLNCWSKEKYLEDVKRYEVFLSAYNQARDATHPYNIKFEQIKNGLYLADNFAPPFRQKSIKIHVAGRSKELTVELNVALGELHSRSILKEFMSNGQIEAAIWGDSDKAFTASIMQASGAKEVSALINDLRKKELAAVAGIVDEAFPAPVLEQPPAAIPDVAQDHVVLGHAAQIQVTPADVVGPAAGAVNMEDQTWVLGQEMKDMNNFSDSAFIAEEKFKGTSFR